MAATAALTMIKAFTYRGAREEWSNTYHLDQVPAGPSVWNSLAAAVWALEERLLLPDVSWEFTIGHEPGNPAAVYEFDPTPAGAGGPPGVMALGGGDHQCPGDAAVWVRWGTTQRTSRGKPIYLRSYYHCATATAAAVDNVGSIQAAAMAVLGNTWTQGVAAGGQTFHRAGPNGAVAQSSTVGEWVTTRTLKARGKRKKASTKLLLPGTSIPPGDYTIN